MRCRLCLPCYILIPLAILIAGCTQPAPDLSKPVSPTPAYPGFPNEGISLQPTLSQAVQAAPATVITTGSQKRETADPDFTVDIAVPEKIFPGTTVLPDNHNAARPRIIEVNQYGEILWEYPLPDDLKSYTNPGWDVEMLENGNILTVLPRNGVYEINRDKQVVWKYLDSKVSHDADRLKNGNTLVAFGAGDTVGDARVKEIDPSGNLVWSWYAKDVFSGPEYAGISNEGWTHTNAVSRLENGNTLVSMRNFNLIAEVDHEGNLIRIIGKGLLIEQHDPLVLLNGNILLANHGEPQGVIELNPSENVVWQFMIPLRKSWPVRDANRLPNGNTLITESDRIVEVTNDRQVVWQFRLTTSSFSNKTDPANSPQSRGFYKAVRISL